MRRGRERRYRGGEGKKRGGGVSVLAVKGGRGVETEDRRRFEGEGVGKRREEEDRSVKKGRRREEEVEV